MDQLPPEPQEHWVVVCYHDESTFYANDRCKLRWKHKDAIAVLPREKVHHKWLPTWLALNMDGCPPLIGKKKKKFSLKQARTEKVILQMMRSLIKPITQWIYLTNTSWMKPTSSFLIMPLHIQIAPKELCQLITCPKIPQRWKKKNWGAKVNQCHKNGKPMYRSGGKILKTKIPLTNGQLPDGIPQSFYFESGSQAGLFKGMTIILQEWGLIQESKICAECKKFDCLTIQVVPCCQHHTLYNQPDFREVKSHLEIICEAWGYEAIFLLKFHCELNFTEQYWGYAKRIYWHYPPFPKEADLEANVLSALESVPLKSMRRYTIHLIRSYMSPFFITIRFAV
jgi:hypothetical protein